MAYLFAMLNERKPLIDADAVAYRLGVKRFVVYDLAREGKLPCVRLGRAIRFDEDTIEEWIKAGGTGPWSEERHTP